MAAATVAVPDPTRLIIVALAGLVILLFLIIKFKVQAAISVLVGAVIIGLVAGIPFGDIISSMNEGIGSTLRGIALLMGLGSMFGPTLEISGGAQTLAATVVKKFGDRKAAWALGITGPVIAIPVLFDVGLAILIPLAFSLAKRTEHSPLFYAIPPLVGLAVGHASTPPTLGSMLVIAMLGMDLGWAIMVGIVCGIFAMIAAGPIWGVICRNKYNIPVPKHIVDQEDFDEPRLPKFGVTVGVILIPLILIILNSIVKVIPALASVQPVLGFLDKPPVALTIATVMAVVLLGYRHGYSNEEPEKVSTRSLEPTELILLVTAYGDVLRFILQNPGLGDMIGNAVSSASLPIVAVAFAVAVLVHISVGSATIAMAMAVGIITATPEIATMSPLYLAYATAAVAGGVMICSHFNDSGFWLMKPLVGLDEETALKVWTIMGTLVGDTGFVVAPIMSFFA